MQNIQLNLSKEVQHLLVDRNMKKKDLASALNRYPQELSMALNLRRKSNNSIKILADAKRYLTEINE